MDEFATLNNNQFVFLIGWCVLVLAVGWCVTFWIIRLSPISMESVLRDGLLPKLLTIILILLATTILALTGKLNEAAAAIFSGIVGYVLGTTGGGKKPSPDQEKPNKCIHQSDN